jgi:fermentation-respiration switch protein FrsA (DUF1100 family)
VSLVRRALLVSGLASAGALLAAAWIIAERATHPWPRREQYDLLDFDLPVEQVRFPSRDGLRLAGWFIPGASPACIILAHGHGRSRGELLPHADFLYRAGFSVFLFDFRSRGESEGKAVTLGVHEPLDILGALDHLSSRSDVDAQRIGVLGLSLGATAVLIAAAETADLRAVVAESSFARMQDVAARGMRHFFHLPALPFAPVAHWMVERQIGADLATVDPLGAASRISPRPLLLIDDENDDVLGSGQGQALFDAAGEPRELWVVPLAAHARGWQAAAEEYERRVVEFFRRHLG